MHENELENPYNIAYARLTATEATISLADTILKKKSLLSINVILEIEAIKRRLLNVREIYRREKWG